jgi:phage shock protein C
VLYQAGIIYNIDWLRWTSDATWVILPLIFLLVLLLGYASLLSKEQAARAANPSPQVPQPAYQAGSVPRRLYRSGKNRMLGGVCAGLAEHFNVDPSVMRIIWVLLLVVSFGTALLAYIILWIIIPRDPQGPW